MSGFDTTKVFDGYSPAKLNCPKCSSVLTMRTHFQAVTLICTSCFGIIDVRKNAIVGKINKKENAVIPIGAKGELNGIKYEVVGYIKFREYKTIYTWNDYTLFNPIYGYAYLSEYNGHWSFTEQTHIFPLKQFRTFDLLQQTFNQFNDYIASIDYAEGEFNWYILNSEKIKIVEYLSPPYMLIKETSASELIWYRSEYVETEDVVKSFKLKKNTLPIKSGVGVLQPSIIGERLKSVGKFTGIFLAILFITQILFVSFSSQEQVFEQSYGLDSLNTIVTPSFKLNSKVSGSDNVEVGLYAPVDNSWFEAAITLVNDETGEEYYFEEGVEYYHGYEDGYWAEGDTRTSKVLSQIPDGKYHLNISPYIDSGSSYHTYLFQITVTRGVGNWSNFFLILFMSILYPLILYIRNNYFEYERWSGSNYSYD